ncbi:hypothetical protein PLCT1_00780 [Planctomycetaceae bacterium]|nr:hypothetical protein PLCT1_00780 [Planctomycetaceae bacterium]
MANSSIGKTLAFWGIVLLLSPILIPIIVLQMLGVIRGSGFKWDYFPADRDVPLRRWTRCVNSIVANDNSTRLDEFEPAKEALSEAWGVRDRNGYDRLAAHLNATSDEDLAWNVGRLLGVTRMAMAAKLVSEEDGWQQIREGVLRLQKTYGSWHSLAEAMADGLRRQAKVDPEPWNEPALKLMASNVESLSKSLWSDTPWDLKV